MRAIFMLAAAWALLAGNQTQERSHAERSPLLILDPDPPTVQAKRFAPGTVCTSLDDWAICFSPQEDEIYFTVTGRNQATIVYLRLDGAQWRGPEVATFSGEYFDYAPVISHEGNRLIFCSQRPASSDSGVTDTNLWVTYREGDGWSEPSILRNGVNTEGTNDVWPSLASNGDLYFSSNRDGGIGNFDLYVSEFNGGKYGRPENLGSVVNSELGEYCPFVAPDGSYLIFEIVDATDGLGGGDMYISTKQPDGSWGDPANMGEAFNTRRHDCYPRLSRDGDYLFFMSDRRSRTPRRSEKRLTYGEIVENAWRSGGWDIYWIDAVVLDRFLIPDDAKH